MGRTIAIGDVHGCLNELNELLEKLELQPSDRLIFLGDLINRGPNSHGVVKRVRGIPGAITLLGNHELRLLRYARKEDPSILRSTDEKTIATLTKKDWRFLRHALLPYFYESALNTIFVHGGFTPDKPWYKQSLKTITGIQLIDNEGNPTNSKDCPQGIPWADTWHGPPFVVYGHFPRSSAYERPHSIGIDTGCVHGGALTAYILPDKHIVQVPARMCYSNGSRLFRS